MIATMLIGGGLMAASCFAERHERELGDFVFCMGIVVWVIGFFHNGHCFARPLM